MKKIHQSAPLFWFGLRNDEIFYLRAAIQRTIDASPTFMEYSLAKKIAAWAHANRDPNKQEDWIQLCMKRLRTLKSFKIFKSEIKKLKIYSGWCPFKGLSTLMQIQSGRTVPLKRSLPGRGWWLWSRLAGGGAHREVGEGRGDGVLPVLLILLLWLMSSCPPGHLSSLKNPFPD